MFNLGELYTGCCITRQVYNLFQEPVEPILGFFRQVKKGTKKPSLLLKEIKMQVLSDSTQLVVTLSNLYIR